MYTITVPARQMKFFGADGQYIGERKYFWEQLKQLVQLRAAHLRGVDLLELYPLHKEITGQDGNDTLTISRDPDYQKLLVWVKENDQWLGNQPLELAHEFVQVWLSAEKMSEEARTKPSPEPADPEKND